jgi:hypothetical protein
VRRGKDLGHTGNGVALDLRVAEAGADAVPDEFEGPGEVERPGVQLATSSPMRTATTARALMGSSLGPCGRDCHTRNASATARAEAAFSLRVAA